MLIPKDAEGFFTLPAPDAKIEALMDQTFTRVGPLKWQKKSEPVTVERSMLRFDASTRTLWLPRPNKQLEERLDAEYERSPGKLRWKVRPDGPTLGRALSWVRAHASGSLDASDPIVVQRLASCNGCDALKRDENGAWCIPCGCGAKNMMVILDGTPAPKMLFRTLNCPKFMPGYTNAQK